MKPKRIMLFQGSPRREDNCPKQNGKTQQLASYIHERAPKGVIVDYCDLSVDSEASMIRPCKGCISTAGGYHCHWPCDCYRKGSDKVSDFMHDNDVYTRLQASDGFLVLTPIHWYSCTSVVKSLFDRLVCASLTLTVEQSRELGLGKDPVKTRAAEKAGAHDHWLKNHLAGKFAAFFAHGDGGGSDYYEFANEPKENMPHLPKSLTDTAKDAEAPEGKDNNPREAVMPLVWQCRYAGINVPDELVDGMHINQGIGYAEAMDRMPSQQKFFDTGLALFQRLVKHIQK